MTISSSAAPKAGPFIGNGVTTSFPFTFKVFDKSEVKVTLAVLATGAESVLVIDTNYTVTLNPDQNVNPGGSVTYSPSGTPMAATHSLTLTSNVLETQGTDITNGGGFYPEVIEDALDRAVILVKQLREVISRSLSIPVSSTASTVLPAPTASTFIGWNAAGSALVNYASVTATPVSAFMATVLDDATAGAALTTLGVSAFAQTLLDDADAAAARATLGAAASGAVTSSGLTMSTARLLGRTTALAGAIGEISTAGGLNLSGGVLTGKALGASQNIGVSTTLTASDMNKHYVSNTNAAVYTLPDITAAMDGDMVAFSCNGTVATPIAITPHATDSIATIDANPSVYLKNYADFVLLVANSANNQWYAFVSSSRTSIQTFAASGTWAKPSGLRYAEVLVIGGGGGGGNSDTANGGGGGGGGGTSFKAITSRDLGATETVTVAATAAAQTTGNSSSFGAHCSATGGAAGTINMSGGAGGAGSGGNINLSGSSGRGNHGGIGGDGGGPAFLGRITASQGSPNATGRAGQEGCGGAGATVSSAAGGAGGGGMVIVWEHY